MGNLSCQQSLRPEKGFAVLLSFTLVGWGARRLCQSSRAEAWGPRRGNNHVNNTH